MPYCDHPNHHDQQVELIPVRCDSCQDGFDPDEPGRRCPVCDGSQILYWFCPLCDPEVYKEWQEGTLL